MSHGEEQSSDEVKQLPSGVSQRGDVLCPVDYTFGSINVFVHHDDVRFEELQWALLGMATEHEKVVAKMEEKLEAWSGLLDDANTRAEMAEAHYDELNAIAARLESLYREERKENHPTILGRANRHC